MKNRFFILLFITVWLMILTACHNSTERADKIRKPLTQKQLIAFNKRLMRQEKRQIDAFIRARHWKMKETGTGLRYQILSAGSGARARTGQRATIRYSVKLLNGQEAYAGIKTFKIGFGGVASGLEEGILLMKKGDVARFVLPSHLAYGLSGDGDKIPPHTPVIYRVELLELK